MKFEFSAGGVVYKTPVRHIHETERGFAGQVKGIEILVAQHSYHHGWVFPKGLIGDKEDQKRETKEEAAVREVEEETGAKGKIIYALTPTQFCYKFEGEKIKKTVYYFIMEYIGGDISKHDFEMEHVEWLPIAEVEDRLTFKNDKKVWKEAEEYLKNQISNLK